MTEEVCAAGGVVWRRAEDGAVEVAFVHRPAYDDWELPKGKLNPGETEPDAALREVQKETGCTADSAVRWASPQLAPTDARPRERVVAELRRRQEQAAASEFTAYWARLADRAQGAAAISASPEPPSTTATPAR